MTTERKIAWLFGINAFINWTLSLRAIFDPVGAAAGFGFDAAPGEFTFVLRLWAGFVFMFGCMFWETCRDVRGKAVLIKYNWIEKSITAAAVTLGFFAGQTPNRLMITVTLTNWAWIPFLAYFDFRLRSEMGKAARIAAVA